MQRENIATGGGCGRYINASQAEIGGRCAAANLRDFEIAGAARAIDQLNLIANGDGLYVDFVVAIDGIEHVINRTRRAKIDVGGTACPINNANPARGYSSSTIEFRERNALVHESAESELQRSFRCEIVEIRETTADDVLGRRGLQHAKI